jgi:hypothetical protein
MSTTPFHRFAPRNGPARSERKITQALRAKLDEPGLLDRFVQVGWEKALAGDFRFWQYIYHRLEDKGD